MIRLLSLVGVVAEVPPADEEVVARAVVEYFDLEDNRDLVGRLLERGIDFPPLIVDLS